MSMQEDRRRYRAAGLAHEEFVTDGPKFAKLVTPMLDRIAKDPTLVVATRSDTLGEDGMQTEWHYLKGRRQADGKVAALAEGEDDCAFNIAVPCPPSCNPPPNGD
jgi:hypothetical protein